LALVNFVSPYHKITGTKQAEIEAESVRELCLAIIDKYGDEMKFLLDENNELSRKIVLFVNGRNAYTLKGSDTSLNPDSKVHIMSFLGWA